MGSNAAEAAAACTMVAVGAVVTEDENASLSWSRDIPEPPMPGPLTELLFAVA
jgi:hypothetical protein